MKDYNIIKLIFNDTLKKGNFKSKEIDENLVKDVKKTTKLLLKNKPEITYEDLLINLLLSAKKSYIHLICSKEIESLVNLFMNLADIIVKEEGEHLEDNEMIMLKEIFKGQLIANILINNFNMSVKAITEVWNGSKGMEF